MKESFLREETGFPPFVGGDQKNFKKLFDEVIEAVDSSSAVTPRILTYARNGMINIVIIGMLIVFVNVVLFLRRSVMQGQGIENAILIRTVGNSSFLQNLISEMFNFLPNESQRENFRQFFSTQVGMQMEESKEFARKKNGKATAAERRDAYIKAFFYIGLAAVSPKRANAPNP